MCLSVETLIRKLSIVLRVVIYPSPPPPSAVPFISFPLDLIQQLLLCSLGRQALCQRECL